MLSINPGVWFWPVHQESFFLDQKWLAALNFESALGHTDGGESLSWGLSRLLLPSLPSSLPSLSFAAHGFRALTVIILITHTCFRTSTWFALSVHYFSWDQFICNGSRDSGWSTESTKTSPTAERPSWEVGTPSLPPCSVTWYGSYFQKRFWKENWIQVPHWLCPSNVPHCVLEQFICC